MDPVEQSDATKIKTLKYPATCTKEGPTREELEESITSKLKCIFRDINVEPNEDIKTEAIQNVVQKAIIRVNKGDGKLDQRHISNQSFANKGLLPNTFSSPQEVSENRPKKQGVTKPKDDVQKYYKKAQKVLSVLKNMTPDEKNRGTVEFCNEIDEELTKHYAELLTKHYAELLTDSAACSITDMKHVREELLPYNDENSIVQLCLDILQGRVLGDWYNKNDLFTDTGYQLWRNHREVLASFATLLTVLEIIGLAIGSSSILKQLS